MDEATFAEWSRKAAEWGATYRASLRDRPVRAQTAPGDIAAQIPANPPQAGENMEAIFADFEKIIMPGMTHWQHPRFFAYFPANAAPVSVVAEYLVTAIAAQCMLWQTSPAATELETKVLDWLRQAIGLPEGRGAPRAVRKPPRDAKAHKQGGNHTTAKTGGRNGRAGGTAH